MACPGIDKNMVKGILEVIELEEWLKEIISMLSKQKK